MTDKKSFTVVVRPETQPPRIAEFGFTTEGRFAFLWESEPGSRYRVQFLDALPGAEWLWVEESIVTDGSVASFTEKLQASAARYYRVVRSE